MIKKVIKMLAFAVFAVVLVSCSSYPTELITTANNAVTELSAVQPEIYAPDAFVTLQDSLTGSIALADKAKSTFLFHNYKKANAALNGVISYADSVKVLAVENKAKAKAELFNVLANVKTLNDESIALLPKAPTGKEGRAALIAIKNDIILINTEYDFVNSQVEISTNLYELLDRAKAVQTKASSVNQELKDAISKVK